MENLRSRMFVAIVGIIIGLMWFSPNIVNLEKMPWWPAKKKLTYGLDIQGGLHLVMGVDVNGVVTESSTRLAQQLKSEFDTDKVAVTSVEATNPGEGEITIKFAPNVKEQVMKHLSTRYSTVLQVMSDNADSVTTKYYSAYMNDYKTKVVHQAIETIRNRIDEFGVAEPSISAQGDNRILVQLPGIADAERAKTLIKTAARLEFRMVDGSKSPQELQAMIVDAEKAGNYNLQTLHYSDYINRLNKDLTGKLPDKTMVLFEKSENAESIEAGHIPFLVRTDTNLGGEDLNDAVVSFGQYGQPEVAITFNSQGANKFAELTGANVGKNMAIVLDKVIKSAPVIQTKISGGHGVITLGGGRDHDKQMNEAKMIATSLRAGALPAALEQLEERTVGPTLGMDSLRKAQFAGLIGLTLIVLFMILRYKTSGVIADICLLLNILFTLALLSSLGATLTLPGIAGIALTMGFAVDSNVLIYERIREELRHGSGYRLALKEGYHRAMSAILDSNITTAATAVVLLYFGTGPVKGFAVTLLIGIGTTLFCNVFISKVIFDNLVYRFNAKKISV